MEGELKGGVMQVQPSGEGGKGGYKERGSVPSRKGGLSLPVEKKKRHPVPKAAVGGPLRDGGERNLWGEEKGGRGVGTGKGEVKTRDCKKENETSPFLITGRRRRESRGLRYKENEKEEWKGVVLGEERTRGRGALGKVDFKG